jgi:molybdopterin-guanine dinucleotide biosynthesis protein A
MNCYVLIGGRSSRMGRSKVGMFLGRVTAAARPVFDEVIAVQRHGEPAAEIHTIYEDRHEGDGAIFGVQRALRHANDRCFILAVDYPAITSAVLELLRDDGRVPVWNGRPQPLCAVWDPSQLSALESRIARGRLDLRGLRERELIAEQVMRQRFAGEPLANVNTPEELEALRRIEN